MLTLYVRTGCPFCHKVLDTVAELDVDVEQKNIADQSIADELVALGGKRQVPYLVDSDRGVALYESMDIDSYLRSQYPKH